MCQYMIVTSISSRSGEGTPESDEVDDRPRLLMRTMVFKSGMVAAATPFTPRRRRDQLGSASNQTRVMTWPSGARVLAGTLQQPFSPWAEVAWSTRPHSCIVRSAAGVHAACAMRTDFSSSTQPVSMTVFLSSVCSPGRGQWRAGHLHDIWRRGAQQPDRRALHRRWCLCTERCHAGRREAPPLDRAPQLGCYMYALFIACVRGKA